MTSHDFIKITLKSSAGNCNGTGGFRGHDSLRACSGGPWLDERRAQTPSACRGWWVFGTGAYGPRSLTMCLFHEPCLVRHCFLSEKRLKPSFLMFFSTFLSPQCCRRWFLGRSRRKTAWAWLRGAVLVFRVAASSPLSLKVAPHPTPPLSILFFPFPNFL